MFLVVVLATTGVWLLLTYAPGREQTLGLSSRPAVTPTRLLHRLAGWALVPVAAGLLVSALAGLRHRSGSPARSRSTGRAAGAAVLVALVGALVWSGYLLPWDQLALAATGAGGRFRGMLTAAFDPRVVFVRIGGDDVTQAGFRARLLLHVAGLPALAVLTGAVTARARRGRRTATGAPPPPTGGSGR